MRFVETEYLRNLQGHSVVFVTCSNSEDVTSFGVMTSAYAEKKQWMKDRDLMEFGRYLKWGVSTFNEWVMYQT